MIVHVDTSALVNACSGRRAGLATIAALIESRARLVVSALALYEWQRGPRTPEDLELQERLLPAADAIAFGPEEASVAAALYKQVRRPRGRDVDLAIAACAVAHDAALWTLNRADFDDIPGLRLL
ncbi:MAG: PIN domain-containing protein [Vicinamibacterales bacterium]